MARISSLTFIDFANSASSDPTDTQIANTITHFYKLIYSFIYGTGTYSADESTDTDSIIDSDEMRAAMDAYISQKINQWHNAGASSGESITWMPVMELSNNFKKALRGLVRTKRKNKITNVRLWNEALDDVAIR